MYLRVANKEVLRLIWDGQYLRHLYSYELKWARGGVRVGYHVCTDNLTWWLPLEMQIVPRAISFHSNFGPQIQRQWRQESLRAWYCSLTLSETQCTQIKELYRPGHLRPNIDA